MSSDNSQLPQHIHIVDGVQSWCLDNKMRLNTSKRKVLFIPSPTEKTPQSITLNNEALEVVKSYKYLGVYLNKHLDCSQQWEHVQQQTNSIPHLIKQLKRQRFILITNLALNKFLYNISSLSTFHSNLT